MGSNPEHRIPQCFFLEPDVVQIARALIGKILVSQIDGVRTSGMIVETEAYRGADDRACHAYNFRRTSRTEPMFSAGGHAYIYLCYGIHHLFNVVTGPKDQPDAVLVRALEPLENLNGMLQRRRHTNVSPTLTAGPGALTQALGIHTRFSGKPLFEPDSPIWIESNPTLPVLDIQTGTRVGVLYAGTCAFRPWRFSLAGSPWVSKAKGAEQTNPDHIS